MADFSGQDISGKLVNVVIANAQTMPHVEGTLLRERQLVAYFKGARIALRFMQGVADERWDALSVEIGDALDRLPGGDNPGHYD